MKRTIVALALAASAPLALAQTQGVTKDEIVVGSLQDLSGPLAGFGKQLRNGMILRGVFGTRCLWGAGRTCNDIYGLDGLTLVLSLSLFTIVYLNLKGMMEALDPALEEAATSLGGSKWRVFRTVTVPMLIPGILGAFLLLFVEAGLVVPIK